MSLDGEKMLSKSQTIKLVSAEGFEFIIDRKAAVVSNTLRNMLSSSGNFTETELGEVKFPEISTPILEKVCQYFYWSLQFSRFDALQTSMIMNAVSQKSIYTNVREQHSCLASKTQRAKDLSSMWSTTVNNSPNSLVLIEHG
nr:uncharacterized protein LOC112288977 isoform X2 [Physcomitrium patens]|eukprot:XP_024389576.1 uncharacterized protein LOC112288977 isoform X2 [Physcomitrella patens]